MSKQIEHISQDFLEGFWNSKLYSNEFMKEYLSSSVIYSGTIVGDRLIGIKPLVAVRSQYESAFPNLKVKCLRTKTFEQCVVSEWHFSANHLGKFNIPKFSSSNYYRFLENIEPLGNEVSYKVETILTFHNQKVSKYKVHVDTNEIYKQLNISFSHAKLLKPPSFSRDNARDILNFINCVNGSSITFPEATVLSLQLIGFSLKQIGSITSKSCRTVEMQAKLGLKKLKFFNKNHLFEYLWYNEKIHAWHEFAKIILLNKGLERW